MNSSLGFSALKVFYHYRNWKKPFAKQDILYYKERVVQLGSVSKWFWKKLRHLYQKYVRAFWFTKLFSVIISYNAFGKMVFFGSKVRIVRKFRVEEELIREAFDSEYFRWFEEDEEDNEDIRKIDIAITYAKMLVKRGVLIIVNTRKGTFLRPEEPHGGRDDGNELDEAEEKALEYYWDN